MMSPRADDPELKSSVKIKRRCGGGESAIKVLYKVLESDKLPLTTIS